MPKSKYCISALVPAYNEEKNILATVSALKSIALIEEVLVIDDGSQDKTALIAKQAGAEVLSLSANCGKGKAVWLGLEETAGEILVLADADLGESAKEFNKLIPPVIEGQAGMVIAKFPPKIKKGGVGLVKSLACWGIKFYTGFNSSSSLSGQIVFLREIFNESGYVPHGFGLEVFLTISCLRKGYNILEIPVNMCHRESGRDLASVRHRGRQLSHVAYELWCCRKIRKVNRKWQKSE